MHLIKRIISVLLSLVLLCTAAYAQDWASEHQTVEAEQVLHQVFGYQLNILAYDGLGTMGDGAFAFLVQDENQDYHLAIAESIDGEYGLTVDNTNPRMNGTLPVQLAMNMTVKPDQDGVLAREYELILSYTYGEGSLIKVFAHSAGNSPEWHVDQLVYDLQTSGYVITLLPDRLLIQEPGRKPDHYEMWDLFCPGNFTTTDLSSFKPDSLPAFCSESYYDSYVMKDTCLWLNPFNKSENPIPLGEDEYVFCYFSIGDWTFVFCPEPFTYGFVPTSVLPPRLYGDVSQCEIDLSKMNDQDRHRYPDGLLESAIQTVKDYYADSPGVTLYEIEYADDWTKMMYEDRPDDLGNYTYKGDNDAFICFYVDIEYTDGRYYYGDPFSFLMLAHERNGQWHIVDGGS